MSFEYLRKIPSANEIISRMPIPEALRRVKKERDRQIIDIFTGKSDKLLVIIGPCSADNEKAVCEYVSRLQKLQDEVEEKLLLVPRVYTNKPRTTGEGYKGMMHQPDPKDKPNIVEGIKALRKMHLKLLKESGLTAADEMLYPANYPYVEDLLSYVAIGARSVENQQHRLTVSGLDIPVGMKNPTSGDLNVMLNSVQAGQSAHVFIYRGWEVKTSGNPYVHSILRGAVNQHGQSIPNYHYEEMVKLSEMYQKRGLLNPAIIVDTNHANSGKKYEEQPRIALEVIRSTRHSKVLKKMLKGFLIESYIEEGSQDINAKVFGRSITDPCLGWDDSRKLIRELAGVI
ncbi:MAG: 3-deoxy-7-phosphoheptulonate synthase [Candidatus Omnitrophica bacterium]|jgi:3-deoxy-7-phosphoheptulonate synthase|nr:3-deoxy-7-phosphoheptulonate synthase [Candidatus Omnitrophota bacterium]MDD5078836.1 3-deoxy-7-phosphoheptulonate synthase [Candidatus Omnitrophota bacterium]